MDVYSTLDAARTVCILFGQSSAESSTVWGGVVGSAGAIGLLGPVLYWLCYVHLPAKDAQILELVRSKDEAIKTLTEFYEEKLKVVTDGFREESKSTKEEFRSTLNFIAKHCETETAKLADAFRNELRAITESLRQGEGRSRHQPPTRQNPT